MITRLNEQEGTNTVVGSIQRADVLSLLITFPRYLWIFTSVLAILIKWQCLGIGY